MTTQTAPSGSSGDPSDGLESKGQQTRKQILDAALSVASREGLAGLTIGELAKSVGMSKSGLFAHFRTKDALELAVLEAAVERFVAAVIHPAFQKPRGEPRIIALVENWVRFLDGSDSLPGGSVLISASVELDDRPGASRDFVQKAQRDLITNIEKSARIAVDVGHFREDLDCDQFAWSLYSFVLGYHHFSTIHLLRQLDRRQIPLRSGIPTACRMHSCLPGTNTTSITCRRPGHLSRPR